MVDRNALCFLAHQQWNDEATALLKEEQPAALRPDEKRDWASLLMILHWSFCILTFSTVKLVCDSLSEKQNGQNMTVKQKKNQEE